MAEPRTPRVVAPTQLPPAGQAGGSAPARPPEVAPSNDPASNLAALGFGGDYEADPVLADARRRAAAAPTRPPEVAPPAPRPAAPMVAAAPRPAPAAPPVVGGTGGPVSDGPSVTVRIPFTNQEFDVRTPTIADSPPWVPFLETPFDKQQAWRKTHQWDGRRIAPVVDNAVITSGFRMPWRRDHDGLDMFIPANGDRRIVAPIGGFIDIDRSATGGEGCMVTIYGDDGRKYQMLHLRAGSIPSHWHTGDRVEMGELVGIMGKTGHIIPMGGGDGTHLHFQVLEPSHQPPRGPRDFYHADPDKYYNEDLRIRFRGDRSKTMRADIDAPMTPAGSRGLQIAVVDDLSDADRPISTALPDAPIPYAQLRPGSARLQVADASPAEPLASPPRPEPAPAKPPVVSLNGLF